MFTLYYKNYNFGLVSVTTQTEFKIYILICTLKCRNTSVIDVLEKI